MRTDDELLAHVRREATGRTRRRRAVVGGAAVLVMAVGAGALAADRSDRHGVATEPGTTTEPTTTEPTTTEPSTTTTAPPTATTEPYATTTSPATTVPVDPRVTTTARGESNGLTVDVVAVQDRHRPGEVELTVRMRTARGGRPFGDVAWTSTGVPARFGVTEHLPPDEVIECDELMWDPPEPLTPDPVAGPLDETYTLHHTYPPGVRTTVVITAWTSFCSLDQAVVDVVLDLQVVP